MVAVQRRGVSVALIVTFVATLAPAAMAGPLASGDAPCLPYSDQSLAIREIQYTTDPNGVSPHDGYVVDCAGGICTGKYAGNRPRIILQDPDDPSGWGGIQVKDWTLGDLFDNVNVGDWVSLENVLVEEFVGNTLLQWQTAYNPQYTIVSRGNPLPPPLLVTAGEIPAPIYDPNNFTWYVDNHDAERYESMRLVVQGVAVTDMDHGKAQDNYNLRDWCGHDCWAADYMNEDVGPWGYHPSITNGRRFCEVSGVLEQYTSRYAGWDYYQLLTLTSDDLTIPCLVNLADVAQAQTEVGPASATDVADWP